MSESQLVVQAAQPQQEASPFAGIAGGYTTNAMPENSNFKMAIVGAQKSGKSWLAATAPGPIFIADFDERRQSLDGVKRSDIFVKSYFDYDQTNPQAIAELEVDLGMFKYNKSKGKPVPATYVLDSMTYCEKFLKNEAMKQGGAAVYRTLKVSSTKTLRIPKGWDAINGARGYMEYLIAEFSQLGNLICIFHERLEKDLEDSTPEKTAYTGRYTVDPQYLNTVLSTFNEVFRIKVGYNGKYEVYTNANNEFNCATTWKSLGPVEEPNIQKMLAKHRAAKKSS